MNKKTRFAVGIFYLVGIMSMIYGAWYSLAQQIAPYHQQFLGKAHHELDPKVASLMLDMMGVAGGSIMACGAMLIFMVKHGISEGETWAWWGVLVFTILFPIPLLFRTLHVGMNSPWWLVGFLLILLITALILTKK